MTRVIYLDHAASTPLAPEVRAALTAAIENPMFAGNASAVNHDYGRVPRAAIEHARAQVAALLGARSEQVIFTSGATEANNLALLGLARAHRDRGAHIVSSRIEHRAVLDPLAQLEREGFSITRLDPDRLGRIDVSRVAAALRPETRLVAIQHANSEIGVLQDLAGIGALCRERGAWLHSDAAQTLGKIDINVETLPIDSLACSAHKLYGPKGVGALWIGPRVRAAVAPVTFGGGQEHGLRPGTLPTELIIGFGVAAELAQSRLTRDAAHARQLTERLVSRLAVLDDTIENGAGAERVPGIVSLSFGGVEGESLLARLPGLALATGSACSSASGEPSYVMRALGRDGQLAQSSLRFSAGRGTTIEDIDVAAVQVIEAVRGLRALAAPLPAAPRGWRAGRGGIRSEGFEVIFHIAVDTSRSVTAARVSVYGCPHTLATAAWLVEQLPGRKLENLLPSAPTDWLARFAVPRHKLGRLLAIEDALRNCLLE